MKDKTVGSLNGPWSLLFKAALGLVPLFVANQAWVTTQIIQLREFKAKTESNRYTQQDALDRQALQGDQALEIWKAISSLQAQVAVPAPGTGNINLP